MGSCSMAFCRYSLFLGLAAEDRRRQARLSAIKEGLENGFTEVKALLAAATEDLTCCVTDDEMEIF